MKEENGGYRKKQAVMVIMVFALIGVAFLSASPVVAVGSILACCGLCLWAASMQPERVDDHHHH
jgi:hypothetical protein